MLIDFAPSWILVAGDKEPRYCGEPQSGQCGKWDTIGLGIAIDYRRRGLLSDLSFLDNPGRAKLDLA